MALKPEISIPIAAAVVTMTAALYQNATPTVADIRSLPEGNQDISRASKSAGWTAALIGSAISLIAKDPVIFWGTAAAVLGMEAMNKHANLVNPELRKYIPGGSTQSDPMPEMTQESYVAFEQQMGPAVSEFATA